MKGPGMRLVTSSAFICLLVITTLGGCDEPGAGLDSAPSDSGIGARLPVDKDLNVIVVSFDALRPEYLGVYGNPLAVSPRLDTFAEQALVFDNAYSAAQSTPTSFAAAFTGQYPFKVFLKWKLADVPTLAETFAGAGFRTGGFFNNRQLDPERNFGQGFETFHVDYVPDDETFLGEPLAWVRENKDDRFFIWIHFISPHAPYQVRDMSQAFYDTTHAGRFAEGSGPIDEIGEVDTAEDLARFKDLYTGEVHFADHLFGIIWDSLEEMDLVDRSLVMVTADHGEGLMDHEVLFHQQVYEEVIRIPLLIRHPGFPHGGRSDLRVSNIDFFPTLAAVAGLDDPREIDGRNLRSGNQGPRPLLSTAMTIGEWRAMGLWWGDHKLIANCSKPSRPVMELYDLAVDPGELNNLYGTRPVLADSLRAIMDVMTNGGPCGAIKLAVRGRSATEGMSPEKIAQLTSRGYVR